PVPEWLIAAVGAAPHVDLASGPPIRYGGRERAVEPSMEVIGQRKYAQMSKIAAQIVAELLNTKPNAVLGMATGSTPLGLYQELVRPHKKEQLDFTRLTTFNPDEYVGLPVKDPQS